MPELWDIYDKDRNKTGRTHIRGNLLLKGDYHLVVAIWILNSRNQVLLTKRHPNKHWGNYWECTGGSVTDAIWVNKIQYDDMHKRGLIVPTIKNFYELYPCTLIE